MVLECEGNLFLWMYFVSSHIGLCRNIADHSGVIEFRARVLGDLFKGILHVSEFFSKLRDNQKVQTNGFLQGKRLPSDLGFVLMC